MIVRHLGSKADAADWLNDPAELAEQLDAAALSTDEAELPPVDACYTRYSGAEAARSDPISSRPEFKLVPIRNLEFRNPRYTIYGMLESDVLALWFGDPGTGKSFMGVGAACAVSTGTEWYGRKVTQGPVVYIAGEGGNGLRRRFRAWEIHNRQSLDDAPLYVSTMPAALCDPVSTAKVADAIQHVADQDGPPALVVLDTLARNFGPGDENSTTDMGAFIQAADLIRSRWQCTVLLIHHTGHGDKTRARGAMALKGALDAEYRLGKDEAGVIRLEVTKMKDATSPEPMAFRLCSVELGVDDDEGNPVTSAILELTAYAPATKAGKSGRGQRQTHALEILERLREEHRANIAASGGDPEAAKVLLEDWRQACLDAGIPRPRFHDVKNSLSEQGAIHVAHGYLV